MRSQRETRRWAWEEFGRAELGDVRRRSRLLAMAETAARSPSGLVSEVFEVAAERQGAYDFLESAHVGAEALVDAVGRSCAERSDEESFVYVPIDGSSLTIVDHANSKGFGHVGTYTQGLRGLKVVTAIAVGPAGVPQGVAHLEWWNRPRYKKFASYRPPAERESRKWTNTIEAVLRRFGEEAPSVRLWFQLDREGDSKAALLPLDRSGHWFTVRSQYNRRLQAGYLREKLRCRRSMGEYFLELPRRAQQAPRRARLSVRCGSYTVLVQNKWNRQVSPLKLNAVWVREVASTARGQKPLEWILLTNRPVSTLEQVRQVIMGYAQRWRIEDFHRAWKNGACCVEDAQLRGSPQMQKWATILAAVAIRAERLKHLSRTSAAQPASIEFSPAELKALRLLKERQKKKTETLPTRPPTISEAVTWIAELGGYINRPAQGPPGTKTIQRGLNRLLPAVEILEALADARKKR